MTILDADAAQEPTPEEIAEAQANHAEVLAELQELRQQNMQRCLNLHQQHQMDPMPALMFNRMNFLLDNLIGPIEQSPQRLQFELVYENQIVMGLLKQLEDMVMKSRLLVAGNNIPQDVLQTLAKSK